MFLQFCKRLYCNLKNIDLNGRVYKYTHFKPNIPLEQTIDDLIANFKLLSASRLTGGE